MTHYTLTIYREDDETPWIEVSTDPAHARPYLHLPGEYDVGDVDLLRGRALVSEMLVRVIDPQTGADQSERWITERLGVPQTEEGAGHSAVNGRRARLVEGSAVVLDGMISGVRLSQSFAGFEFALRDIRERHRKRSLFTRTGTATVLPRGVLDGYGQLPGGGWLVPPTRPLAATWRQEPALLGGYFDLSDYWHGGGSGGLPHRSGATVPPELVFTDAMREAAVRDEHGRYPHLAVLWRPLVGGAWRRIERPGGGGSILTREVLNAYPARLRGAGERDGEEVQAVGYIGCSRALLSGQDPLPSDGQHVQVVVLYTGPPSEEYPYHWEGEAGDFLARLYSGEWSEGGRPVTERVDETALARLTTPIRVRLTEPVEDSRAWIEEVYHQLRAAPALDAEGRIAPVTSELPGPDVVLPEITDDVCQPIPGWDHPATDAVTVVRVTYPRDVRVPAEDDPTGERSAGDGIASREITVESRAAEWALDLIGEQVHEIRATLFRALGGIDGEPVTGDVSDETGHALAVQAGAETLDRWAFGGQSSFVALRRSAFPGLRPGAWLIDRRSWRPNYREGRRGGATLVQAMNARVLDPAWLAVRLVDAGPAEQPLATPQLGTVTVDDDGVVTIPVTLIPAGGEAAVYYYVGASAPSDPGQWRLVDRVGETGEVSTPPLPGGSTVWITARGEAEGRRPSDYRAPVSVQTPAVPRILEARATLDGPDPAITGAANAATQGVRVRYAVHDDGTEPPAPLPESEDYPASQLADGLALPASVAPGERLTAEVEGWTGFSGGGVTGQPGPAVLVAVARPDPVLYAECQARIVSATATHTTVQVDAIPDTGTVQLVSSHGVGQITGPTGPVPADAPASQRRWTIERPVMGAGEGQVVWRAEAPGHQPDDDHVVITEVGRDTVQLVMRARVLSTSDSEVVVRVAVGDPVDPQRSASVTVAAAAQGTTVSPPSQSIQGANIRATPDASEAAGGHADFAIPRPASGSGPGRVVLTASRSGRVVDLDAVDVPEQPPGPPAESLRPTLTFDVNTYQEDQYLYHLTAQDHTGSTAGMQYRERRWLAGQSVPSWPSSWTPIGDQPRQIPVAVHASSERFIEVVARDSEGRESLIHRSSVPPVDESTGGWVRGEVDEGTHTAITAAVDEMDTRGLTDTGFTGDLRSGSTTIPTSTAIDGATRATTGLDDQGRLTPGLSDLDRIADGIAHRRPGAGYVDEHGRIDHIWTGTAPYDGQTIGSGVNRATTALTTSARLRTGVEPTADIAGRGADIVVADAESGVRLASESQGARNMLANPGFEAGGEFWELSSGSQGSVIYTTDPNRSYSGRRAAIVTNTGSGQCLLHATDRVSGGEGRYFEVSEGDVIRYGGRVYRESGDGACRYRLGVYDANRDPIGYPSTPHPTTSGSWFLSEATYTVPAGVSYIRFSPQIINASTQTVARFDDAYLTIATDLYRHTTGTRVWDTATTPREVARGVFQGWEFHNKPIIFDPPLDAGPAFLYTGGGFSYHPEMAAHAHGLVVEFLNPGPEGAHLYAMLVAADVTLTPDSEPFTVGAAGEPGWTATVSAAREAYDRRYTYHYDITLLPGARLLVGYYYRASGTWILAGTRWYEGPGFIESQRTIAVEISGANISFGLSVLQYEGTPGSLSGIEMTWQRGASPMERDGTKVGSAERPIRYTVIAGGG